MISKYEFAADDGPVVAFCMSTYKRPDFLRQQLETISQQSFTRWQIIISDNDPEASGKEIAHQFNDPRVLYFPNGANLGMIKSFNRSIERAETEYIVMITDDDPVESDMLESFFKVVSAYPGFPIYCGGVRPGKPPGEIEVFDNNNFVFQLLNPKLTANFLWSSCLVRREVVVRIGGLPDYGSPHLSDHAMLALCSKEGGGVMINTIYSHLSSHDSNFSKSNFDLYYTACKAFYKLMTENFNESAYVKDGVDALALHLRVWFISNTFNIKRYFSHVRKDKEIHQTASVSLRKILDLPFMRSIYPRYIFKLIMFYVKYPFYRIR
jgi:GT2 family glycosyltransferase